MSRQLCIALLVFVAAACSGKKPHVHTPVGGSGGSGPGGSGGTAGSGAGGGGGSAGSGDGGGGSGGSVSPGGSGGTAGSGGGGPDLRVAESDRLGDVVPSVPRSVLGTSDGALLVIGTQAVPFRDGSIFGHREPPNAAGYHVHGGIVLLDSARATVRVIDERDGLPVSEQRDPQGNPAGTGASPVLDLAWIQEPDVLVAATGDHLARIRHSVQDRFTVNAVALRAPGSPVDARVTRVIALEDKLYVGTDQGLAIYDAGTLGLDRWVDLGDAPTDVRAMAVVAFDAGVAVALLTAAPLETDPSTLILVQQGTAAVVALPPGQTPVSLLAVHGLVGTIVVGSRDAAGHGALHAFQETLRQGVILQWDVVPTSRLESAVAPLVPRLLATDPAAGVLIVGSGAAMELVELDYDALESSAEPARRRFPVKDAYAPLLPDELSLLAVAPGGDLLVAGTQACATGGRRPVSLLRVRDRGSDQRLLLPWPGSVRSVTWQLDQANTWLSVRDEAPALACGGLPITQLVCELKNDGTCEIFVPLANRAPLADPGAFVRRVMFSAQLNPRQLLLASDGGPSFLRFGDVARGVGAGFVPAPFAGGTGTSAAWGEVGRLWIGSHKEWVAAPQDQDPEVFNARRDHGLGYLQISPTGALERAQRFVRVASDTSPIDVPGLPSDTVQDVLSLGPEQVLVALGVEREAVLLDRELPAAHGDHRGGVAQVQGDQVQVLTPRGFTPGDVVALARGPAGALLALDAEAGLLDVDLVAGEVRVRTPAPWSAPERALSLAVSEEGMIAVGTTERLYLDDGTGLRPLAAEIASGFVWSVAFTPQPLLLAGTDRGLLRVALAGHVLPEQAGPIGSLDRTIWPMPPACQGNEGCWCTEEGDCRDSLQCRCSAPGVCICIFRQPDACNDNPGGPGCACPKFGASTCNADLLCKCDEVSHCTCRQDPAECAGQPGCSCTLGDECDAGQGLTCTNTFCTDGECPTDCSCPTESGCPSNLECTEGRCTFGCAEDCTCDTPSGCPAGQVCKQSDTGPQCGAR